LIYNELTLVNAKIYTPHRVIENGYLSFCDGQITAIGERHDLDESIRKQIDLKGKSLLPGFIDVHVHGGNNYSFMDEKLESFNEVSLYHARNGTTSFLATTTTSSVDKLKRSLSKLAEAIDNGVHGAQILGVHLEGPFINEKRSGAQDRSTILEPDLFLLKEFLASSRNQIKLVTMATERDRDHELINYLLNQNITVSIGHSDASYNEVIEAVKLGVNHSTHHFNGMRPIHHRDPGIAGAGLLLSEITTELIADGFHVHPDMIKLLFTIKGNQGVCLITDAVFCAGLPDGEYERVTIINGEVTLKDGSSLAGSTLTTIKALKNAIQYTGLPIEDLLPSLTLVPARQIGVSEQKGSLEPGKDADFLIVDERLDIEATYVKGKPVYERVRQG
jgi:N-acetylglucosamine-6-phosphate deacetylase